MKLWDIVIETIRNIQYEMRLRRDSKDKKLHPHLRARIDSLLAFAETEGLDVMEFEGFRTFERQQTLYNKGRSAGGKKVTNAKAGWSFHNYGMACDIVFKTKRGNPSWSSKHDWKKLGHIGETCGLKWGGRFKSFDGPHFELITNYKRAKDCLVDYKKGGLLSVWQNI